MRTLLFTGFEPFDGQPINPSAEAVRLLAADPPPGVRLIAVVLPTTYAEAAPALRRAISLHAPDDVVGVGQAGGRAALAVERIAINVDDARIGDNDGVWRVDQAVVPGGPAAYFATLPIKTLVHAIRGAGVPSAVSQSAGTFLCNHVFYAGCHLAATERPGMRCGFIHVPFLPEQVVDHAMTPSMELSLIISGLRIAAETLRDRIGTDLHVAEGAVS